MEFLFTDINKHLLEMEREWLAGRKFGAYMLMGKSGSGKTTFLRQLDADWNKQQNKNMITWFTMEQAIDSLLHDRDIFKEVKTPVVIIENMEELNGKDSTFAIIFDLINNWSAQEKRLFIGTSNCSIFQKPQYITVLESHEIEVTPQIVEQIAQNQNIPLDKERIELLYRETEGRMAKLLGLLQRERKAC